MVDWRRKGSELVRKMEDAFSSKRPIPMYRRVIWGLILGFIVALMVVLPDAGIEESESDAP